MATKPRSIFEEVGTSERPATTTGAIDRGRPDARRWVRLWLGLIFVLVVAMILVGGLTRLTDSGLSITQWNLVTGTIPPMGAADWQAEFDLYRQSPQYELMNQGMTLSDFQFIYWWEWSHRLLGRVIGLVFILGFVGFLATRRLPSGWTARLLTVGVLIGLQGVVGWWMVSSGLENGMTSVASYRLATHLGLAFAILGLLAWDILLLSRRETELLTARRQGRAEAVLGRDRGSCTCCSCRSSLARWWRASTLAGPSRPGPTWPGASSRPIRWISSRSGATSSRALGWCSSSTGWPATPSPSSPSWSGCTAVARPIRRRGWPST
ncbi:Heme A synthase, cytochrome oxidase biogenesis protein Cox15-CtaA [Rubellimicrobium mesophilum DSM 19309]|uniref:Heme A synthase, cytochrome oxidase biogenesis protein Cox15-CtaA n=1 Tax=Rubellimicrobium mesophilum DSM 19309 TaxID=442562 RepID=A0A017HGX5_9RHOB|nr:Heme A synthase, cytochrome oxidase biogenesis protein Cox15-CtaA [Rubellimicrobium mesophilum DSM 19309]